VHHNGELFHLDGGKLGFAPLRTSIPIAIATHSPLTLKLSGRMADAVLLGNMGRSEAIDRAVAAVRDGERESGRAPGSVAVNLRLEAIVSEDREQAFAVLRKRIADRLVKSFPNWDFLGDQAAEIHPAISILAKSKDVDAIAELVTDADIRATALAGDPSEVAAQLSALLTPDVDRVTIRPYAIPGQPQATTVRLFAEQVWPRIAPVGGQ
jgi:5,10-methylenetetrahydromethanopterin reductase